MHHQLGVLTAVCRHGRDGRPLLLSKHLGVPYEPLIDVVKDPVSCALMSGLSRGTCRWPSWVYACVSGTNLSGVLKAQGC